MLSEERPTDLIALEQRVRSVYDRTRADRQSGAPMPPTAAVELDVQQLVRMAETAPPLLSVSERHALLVPAAAALAGYPDSVVVGDAVQRIDQAMADRGIPAPAVATLAVTAPGTTGPRNMTALDTLTAKALVPATPPAASAAPVAAPVPAPVPMDSTATPPASPAAVDRQPTPTVGHDPLHLWVRQQVAGGVEITGAGLAAHLGVSARTGRRRLDQLRKDHPDLFTETEAAAVVEPDMHVEPIAQVEPVTLQHGTANPEPTAALATHHAVVPTADAAPAAAPSAGPAPLAVWPAFPTEDLGPVESTQLRPRPSLVLTTGDARVALTGNAVIGRHPSGEHGQPVPVVDHSRSLSKTHALIQTGSHPQITDLHSSNGTIVRRCGHPDTHLIPDLPFPLASGDVLIVADWIATVEITS